MPQAFTLIRTVPAPGSGTCRSTISKGPFARETCATRITAMFLPPHARRASAPVLATIALKGGGFISEVKARPDVRLVAVDPVNRDGLPNQLAGGLRGKGGVEPRTMGEER